MFCVFGTFLFLLGWARPICITSWWPQIWWSIVNWSRSTGPQILCRSWVCVLCSTGGHKAQSSRKRLSHPTNTLYYHATAPHRSPTLPPTETQRTFQLFKVDLTGKLRSYQSIIRIKSAAEQSRDSPIVLGDDEDAEVAKRLKRDWNCLLLFPMFPMLLSRWKPGVRGAPKNQLYSFLTNHKPPALQN